MKTSPDATKNPPAFRKFLPYVALAVLLSLTVWIWRFYENISMEREQHRFGEYVDGIVQDVTKRLDNYEMILQGGAGIFAASEKVTRDEWRAYYAYRQISALFPGVQGIGFSRVIRPSELAQHIRAIRAEGYPDYTVRPAGEREIYTAIIFLEPFDWRNRRAFGYDMFSEPVRRAAMARARDTGQVSLSGKVTLVQETDKDNQPGFLLYVPIYEKGLPLDGVEERRAALKGYVYAPFRTNDFIRDILSGNIDEIDFELYDGVEIAPAALLYQGQISPGAPGEKRKPMFSSRKTLDLYGHQWTLAFKTTPAFEAVIDRYTSKGILAAGILISLLAFLFIRALENTRAHALSLAQGMSTALRESEQKYRLLNDNMTLGASIIGPNMEVLATNATKRKWFSISDIEKHPPCYSVFNLPSRDEPCEGCPVLETFQDGGRHSAIREAETIQGRRTLSITTAPITDADGKMISVHETVEDITERRQAEEALRESEKRYRSLFDSMTEGFAIHEIIVDETGTPIDYRFLDINPAFERLTGLKREDVVGKTHNEVLPGDDPKWLRMYGAVVLTGEPVQFDNYSPALKRYYEVLAYRTAPRQFSVIFMDITTRKQAEEVLRESEQKYRLLAENAQDAIWTVDLEGRLTYISPAIERLIGYTPAEAMAMPMTEYVVREDYEVLMARLAEELAKPPEERLRSQTLEIRYKAKDGSLLEVEFTAAWLKDDQGNICGVQGSTRDITDQKRAEEDRIARRAAEAASREKSMFLSNMSHEIRTPMNAILGFAQILERDPSLAPEQREHVRTINRSGEHLLRLINDILEMAKIEAGMTVLKPAVFSLHDLLDDLEMMFRSRADGKGLQLLMELDEGVPRYVIADEGKLRQIFVNLMENAVKFTEKGGVVVRVRAEVVEEKTGEGKETLRLSAEVEDTGLGIPAEEMERIFAAFGQAETGVKAGGTGLGLAISQKFVRMMGGELTVESEPGKGSCFRFDVLLKPTEEVAEPEKPVSRRVVGLEAGAGPVRILVVDDVQDNRALLRALLLPVGFEVREAANGQEALALFEQWSPHAVLLDMRMPVMDGYEATRRIKAGEAGRGTPVIAVTASAFKESEEEIRATGVDAYLRKPFRPEEVFETLGRCLELRYVYDDEQDRPRRHPKPPALTPEALAALPEDLIRAMGQAVAEGDMSHLTELIGQVERMDSVAAGGLKALADRYDYEKLSKLLDQAEATDG